MHKKIMSLVLCGTLIFSSISLSFADSTRVVTVGVDNSAQQKEKIIKYFGVNLDEVELITVNNQEERKYLEGIASEAQLGKKTYSCAYVEPTKTGSGINVKTANLTWLTSSMVASTLSTAGLTDADVVVASTFPVSGTGALTGIMKAFEYSTGEPLEEEKKELASEELIITGDIGEDIGADKATGIVNDIKTEIIKNNTSDTIQIADTINNVTNNYNITLTPEQLEQLEDLMVKISKQDYDYNQMKSTLKGIRETVNEKLDEMGEGNNQGFFESIKNWFSGLFSKEEEKDLGILGSTDDSILGDNAIIDSTDKNAINLPSSEEVEGFFTRILNWFKNIIGNNDKSESNDSVENIDIITEDNDIITDDNDIITDDIVEDSKKNNTLDIVQDSSQEDDLNNKLSDDELGLEESDSSLDGGVQDVDNNLDN